MISRVNSSGLNSNSVSAPDTTDDGRAEIIRAVEGGQGEKHADGLFEEIQEGAPTQDQVNSILEYLGPSNAGSVIKDATGTSDALRKFKANESSFQRPITVDWNNGRAGTYVVEQSTGSTSIPNPRELFLMVLVQLWVRTKVRS